MPWLTNSAI